MSKVSGSIASVVRGVSQQIPEQRVDGQHAEQINMLSDPVTGLARRRGSIMELEQPLFAGASADALADHRLMRTRDFTVGLNQYTLLYRADTRPAGSSLTGLYCYNKTTKANVPIVVASGDTNAGPMLAAGVSAITQIGRYVLMASKTHLAQGTATDVHTPSSNSRYASIWIRGGAYSRTFTVKVERSSGGPITVSYTTPASSYPGVLDTSDISPSIGQPATTSSTTELLRNDPAGNIFVTNNKWNPTLGTASVRLPNSTATLTNVGAAIPANAGEWGYDAGDNNRIRLYPVSSGGPAEVQITYSHTTLAANPFYQRQVDDRTNEYNSAVTAWIGTAAAAIQPSAIATQLQSALVTAGLTGVTRQDAHILFDNTTITGITITDNGDGSLGRAVHQQIPDIAQVTDVHYIGKVIKVQPADESPAFYLVARAKVAGATGFGQVVWEEGAGTSFTPGIWFLLGTVESGSFHVASTPALLQASTGVTVPGFAQRLVGDSDSNRAPYFIGRTITFLGTLQDRLVVGSGAVLSMSKVGDYFNLFRTSVLTVLDDDPAEVYALGGEDDVIRHGVILDKSLLAFGDQRQYGLNGRVPVTPKTASVIQSSAHINAADAAPAAIGDLVFYLQHSDGYSRLYQMETGDLEDTTRSTDVSNQLNSYMAGSPRNMLATASPSMLLIQTEDEPRTVYTFRYLDIQGGRQRVQDAWSKWMFAPECGDLLGMSYFQGQILLFWSRTATDAGGVLRTYLVVDSLSLLSSRASTPHLDSQRRYTSVVAGASTRAVHGTTANAASAYDSTVYPYLQGERDITQVPAMLAEFPTIGTSGLWTGFQFPASFTMTNPRIRDKNDVAIVAGRLTVTRVDVSYKETTGILATLQTQYGDLATVLDFNGRVLGASNNLLDEQPVSSGSVPVFIGREVREYSLTIAAKDWLPLTVAGLEWTGQFFYNPRRV